MAMSGRQTNTLEEYIQKMMRLISDAKVTAANDPKGLEFLIGMETGILNYVKEPLEQAGMDMSQLQPSGTPQAGAMMGGGPGAAGGATPMPGAGANPTAGSADELRRFLQPSR